MLIEVLYLIGGLVLLIAGGESLVRGASGIALIAKVTPSVVGLTIVAAGTSMPELVVSVRAALNASPGLAFGNVVGSNIFNISAILGLTALVYPLRIYGNTVKFEWPVMMLSAFQLHLLARDSLVDRLEGGFLLSAMIAFIAYVIWVGRKNTTTKEQEDFKHLATASLGKTTGMKLLSNTVTVAISIVLLACGSNVLVYGARGIASSMGISDTVVGLTIVAAGTSAPEMVTSLVAAWRGRNDIAVANVVGSNIFNVLGIVGTTSLIHPLPVPSEIITRDNLWMLCASALLFPLMKSGLRITRVEGMILFAFFIAYMMILIRSTQT